MKRRFAVKFLRPELAEKRESLARFQREAQAAGALESEHLAAAVDFDREAADRNILALRPGMPIHAVSAKTGAGMEEFLDALRARVPASR